MLRILGMLGAPLALVVCGGLLQAQEGAKKTGPAAGEAAQRGSATGIEAPLPPLSEYWLGLEVSEASPALRAQLQLPEGQGLVVERLLPGSQAEKAGLKVYDVLLKAGGQPVGDVLALARAIDKTKGARLPLDLLRGGKPLVLAATPAKRPLAAGQGTITLSSSANLDAKTLEKLLERLRTDAAKGPVRLQAFGTPIIVPPGAARGLLLLPDGTLVTIAREAHKPARITVKDANRRTWEINENELDKLPENLRPAVARMLGQAPFRVEARGSTVPAAP